MMWIRFPNGQCVQYNRANYVVRSQYGYTDIYTKKDGDWLAQVPNSCIIESEFACRVWNPLASSIDEATAREVKAVRRKLDKVLRAPPKLRVVRS